MIKNSKPYRDRENSAATKYRRAPLKKRTSMIFQLIPISIHTNLLMGILITLYLQDKAESFALTIWLSLFIAITIIRDITYFLYRRYSPGRQKLFYGLNFAQMIVSSLIWGLSGFVVLSPIPSENTLLIISLLGVVMAGSSSLSSDWKMMYTFIFLIMGPFTVRILTLDSEYYRMIALFMLIFYGLINFIAYRINRLVSRNLGFEEAHRDMMDQLKDREARFRSIFEHAPSGIFYYNSDLIIYDCNEKFSALSNASKEKFLNRKIDHLLDEEILTALREPFKGRVGTYEGHYSSARSDVSLWISLICSPLKDDEGNITGAVGITQDRSAVHRIEEKMAYMAYHDSLTSLPNRLLLKDRINQALLQSGRHNHHGAILFMDLDNFKAINDSLGHNIGDILLVQVAARISGLLRDEDTVSRVGGDEFVIVLPKLHEEEQASIAASGLVAEKIHKALSNPFELSDKTLYTSTSIGIVLFSKGEGSIDKLLKNADTAMYEAKKEGRSSTHFYNREMNLAMKNRLAMENYLRHAAPRGELIPYFQPIHGSGKGEVKGAEVLLRWVHPHMGLVSPGEFIPLAEETWLILKIGEWLIEEICRLLKGWLDGPSAPFDYLSINISVKQLQQKDFSTMILEKMKAYGIPPSMVVLEITENVLVGNFDKVSDNIAVLRAEGIRFALDDFGTGYSSLTYLKKLELDIIKIDRSFIRDICTDRGDASLVKAILTIARDFGFKVIAEGVETDEQKALLTSMGCRHFQGYYYSRPLPPGEFREYLDRFKS